MTCRTPDDMVEERLDRVLTQYRESPKLLHLLRTYLRAASAMSLQLCDLHEKFDLDSAVGDQLTIIGKRLGFPRTHCICTVQPVFGFECEGYVPDQPLAGFCEPGSTWAGCGEFGTGDITIVDDDLYRRFLKVRVRQAASLFSRADLEASLRDLWGDSAMLLNSSQGEIVVAPGRDLTNDEIALLQIYPRVMPLALGVSVRFHFGTTRVFGFGEGWGGFCEFVDADGEPIQASSGEIITTTAGDDPLETGPLTMDAPWMCLIDVKPYSC